MIESGVLDAGAARVRVTDDDSSGELRDFVIRNRVPFAVESPSTFAPGVTCQVDDDTELANPSLTEVAMALGIYAEPSDGTYDVAVVGAGPAGLAVALYAGSEGLSTVLVESFAPGARRVPRPGSRTTHRLVIDHGDPVDAPAVIVATGVDWRRLERPGVEELLGKACTTGRRRPRPQGSRAGTA